MEHTERMLRIKCGGENIEICWRNFRQLIMKPQVYPVPGAPPGTAGIMEYQGELLGVYGSPRETAACVAVVQGEDGGLYGLQAETVDGGAYGDS